MYLESLNLAAGTINQRLPQLGALRTKRLIPVF